MLCFDLTNIGKCKKNILNDRKKVGKCFQQIFLGGGWALGAVGQN